MPRKGERYSLKATAGSGRKEGVVGPRIWARVGTALPPTDWEIGMNFLSFLCLDFLICKVGIIISPYTVVVGIKRDDCKMPRTEGDKVGALPYVSSFPQRERGPPTRRTRAELRTATHTKGPPFLLPACWLRLHGRECLPVHL